MVLSPLQGFLTALSTAGAPSFSLWVLAFAFGLCGFGFAIWTAATRNANKRWRGNLPAKANGEATLTAPNIPAVIAGMRQAKAKAIAAKGLVLILGLAIGWMWKAQQDHGTYQHEYAAWKNRQEQWQKTVDAWKERNMTNVRTELPTAR